MNVMARACSVKLGLLTVSVLLSATGPAAPAAVPGSPANPETTRKTNGPAFLAVREGVLPGSAPCRMFFLQFQTGHAIAIGEGPGDTSDHAQDYRQAEETGGLDASVIGGPEGFQLAGHGCVFNKVAASTWKTLTAGEVVETLRRESWLYGVVEIGKKDFPATYLFKTARGACGLLQILGAAEDPRAWNGHGMKFRYKLVQGLANAAAGK